MTKANTDFFDLVHSPDDEESTGKGWYAMTINIDGTEAEESGLFETEAEARQWAREHGGVRQLNGAS
ncbi:MAG: hypothetical protein ACPGSI_16565 [Pikeienuella sp.]